MLEKYKGYGDLEGRSIMVTSGSMRGYIDDVRYISNKSTGRLGAAITTEALKREALVTFIYGTGSAIPDIASLGKDCANRLTLIEVETIDDLFTMIRERLKGASFGAIVHAMAVLDYVPEKRSEGKITSHKDKLTINLTKTPKVIKLIRSLWPYTLLIGFKLEVGLSKDELIERAYTSLMESGMDFVVANNQDEIGGDKHRAYLINAHKEVESECETKQDISKNLMDILSKRLK